MEWRMPRRAKPIHERLAKNIQWLKDDGTVTPEILHTIVSEFHHLATARDCLVWQGCHQGFTPIIYHDGKPRPVRRVIFELICGEMQPDWRVERSGMPYCHPSCVHPAHCKVTPIFNGYQHPLPAILTGETFEAEPSMDDELSIEDLADAIMAYDERDPAWLAEKVMEPESRVIEALAFIEEQNW